MVCTSIASTLPQVVKRYCTFGDSTIKMSTPRKSKKKKSIRKEQAAPILRSTTNSEGFASILMKKSIGGVCVSHGFHTAEAAAFQGLFEACKMKLLKLGEDLKGVAEKSKRKQVNLDDFAEVVSSLENTHATSDPLRYLIGIPNFPIETTGSAMGALPVTTLDDSDEKNIAGLPHFPPLPPAHTYKRTKLEIADLPASDVSEKKRIQQRHSALVRESLAKMQRDVISMSSNGKESTMDL